MCVIRLRISFVNIARCSVKAFKAGTIFNTIIKSKAPGIPILPMNCPSCAKSIT